MKNSKPASKAALRAQILHNIPLYLMFLPGAIYLLVNNYIPMGGLIIAFKQVNWNKGILASPWVGLDNFILVAADPGFWASAFASFPEAFSTSFSF